MTTDFTFHVLDQSTYEEKRLDFIKSVEGIELEPYLDTATPPIPTIGYGYNLQIEAIRDLTIITIFYPSGDQTTLLGQDAAFAQDIELAVGQTYSSNGALRSALDAIMEERATYWTNAVAANPSLNHPQETRSTFSFSNEAEMDSVFNVAVETYENRVDAWLSGIPATAQERITLLSLSYNGALSISTSLKTAIQNDNRAEAFYQIRYNTNAQKVDGVTRSAADPALTPAQLEQGFNGTATRRYGESHNFGLYNESQTFDTQTFQITQNTDEAESRQIFQMTTKHWERIEFYDNRFGYLLGAAGTKFGFAVESTDSLLTPAHDLLVNLYTYESDIDKIWVDYEVVIGTGVESNSLDFHLDSLGDVRGESMLILGGIGDDYIRGGAGNDYLYGEADNDIIIADKGADFIFGGVGTDTLEYTLQDTEQLVLTLKGIRIEANLGAGFVDIYLTSGGGKEYDIISGIERIIGASGDDVFKGKAGTVGTFFDGAGQQDNTRGDKADFSDYAAGTSVNVTLGGTGTDSAGGTYTLTNIEQVIGTQSGDTITGDGQTNWLFGYAGNDAINGSGGDDHIIGGGGSDTLEGGTGSDTFYFSLSGLTSLWQQTGIDTITDASGLDTIYLLGGYKFDPTSFTPSGQSIQISGVATLTHSTDIEFVTYSDTAKFSMERLSALQTDGTAGTIDGSTLLGDALANNLVAGLGITTVQGQGGNDWLSGGVGVTLEGGSGEDYLFGAGTLDGGNDNDYLEGAGTGNVIYRASGGVDVIKDIGAGGNLIDAPSGYTLWKADNGSLIIDFSGANDSAGVISSTHKVIVLNHFSGIGNNKLEMINGEVVPTINVQVLTTVLDDVVAGTSGNDSFVAGVGEDFADLGGGANTFTFNSTDTASTTITSLVDAQVDLLVFNGFAQNAVSVVRDASIGTNNLLFSYGQSYVVLQNAVLDSAHANHYNVQFGSNAPVTFASIDLVTRGSYTNDTLNGDVPGFSVDDIIYAGTGNDTINGLTGDDLIYGEEGDDVIDGGSGEDTIYGGAGNDTIKTGSGSDLVIDNAGDDTYILSKGDRLVLGSGHNHVEFEAGAASAGDSSFTYVLDLPDNIRMSDVSLVRSAGITTLNYGGHSVSLAAETKPLLDFADDPDVRVDQLTLTTSGSGNDDSIIDAIYGYFDSNNVFHISAQQNDVIYGNGGNDSITVTGGNDIVYGGDGNDGIGDMRNPQNELFTTGTVKFYGGAGNDTLGNTTFAGELYGEDGNDELTAGNGLTSILDGGAGNDWIKAANGASQIFGGAGNDFIFGLGNGIKTVQAGAGNDYVVADSEANDTIDGGEGLDVISFEMLSSFSGTTQINLTTHSATVLGKTYALTNIEGAVGLQGNDTITGNSGNNFLDGGTAISTFFAGNDTLLGGAGSDTYYFGRSFTAAFVPPSQSQGTPTAPIVGNDIVNDASGNQDTIEFSSYYTLDMLTFNQSGVNLVISFTGGTVTIQNQFSGSKVENLALADGTILNLDNYNSWTLGSASGETMTATAAGQSLYSKGGNDTLIAHSGGSSLHGGLGVDTLTGNAGNDILNGGEGNDIINGGAGDDIYLFSAGAGFDTISDTLGFDVLSLFGNITLSDLVFTHIGNDLKIDIASGVTITNFYSGNANALVEQIAFADGSTFDLTSLLAPVAQNDAFTGEQDTIITGNVLLDNGNGADSDPDGGILSVTAGTFATAHGSITLLANGDFTYTPTAGYYGADTFNYTLSDGQGYSDTGSVNFTLTPPLPVNTAPVAQDDVFVANQDTLVTGNILSDNGNGADSDADNDVLSVVAGTYATAHGSVVIAANGNFTYTPAAGYFGADSFTYTLSDGNGGTDTGSVSITLNEVSVPNTPPTAQNDSAVTNEDTAVTISVLGNDSDANNDPLVVSILGNPASGSVVVNANNTITYTPNADYNGADSFTYQVNDGQGGTSSATVSLTVNSVNDAPLASDDSFSGTEDSVVTGNLLVNNGSGADSDSDGGTLSVTAGTFATANGSVTITANGDFTYTPTANHNGADSFNYTLSDGQGGTDTGLVTLSLAAVNDAPIAVDDVFTGVQNTNITGNLLGNNGLGVDNDIEDDNLSVTAETITTAHGSVVISANGSFIYTPTAGYTGADSFNYTVSDGNGGSDTGAVNITLSASVINGTNGNDTITGSANGDTIHGLDGNDTLYGEAGDDILYGDAGNDTLKGRDGNDSLYGGDGTDYLEGGNGNDLLNGGNGVDTIKGSGGIDTYSYLTALEGGDIIQDFRPLTGEKIDLTPIFQFNPAFVGAQAFTDGYLRLAQSGADVLVYLDADGNAGGGAETLFITLQAISLADVTLSSFILPVNGSGGNTAPTAVNDSATTNEDTAVTISVLGNDSDANNDPLSVSIVSNSSSGTLVVNANNTVTYTPNANFNGSGSFIYQISDGQGGLANATVSLTVNAVNDLPVAMDDVFGGTQDTNITGNLLVNNGGGADTDIDGDTLSVTAQTISTAHGSVVIAANGDFTYTPTVGYSGSDSFNYTLSDGHGGSDTGAVSLTLLASNEILGTSGNDSIYGTANDDVIRGLAGNDFLSGEVGNDTIYGDAGADTLKGRDGNDFLYGGADVDYLEGNNGNDVLYGGAGADTLKGSAGVDTFVFQSMSDAGDTIQDYSYSSGEKIDISDLLVGYDALTMAITDFVQITDNGTNSFLAVDIDGGANNFVQLATLSNVIGLTDEEALETSGRLITV